MLKENRVQIHQPTLHPNQDELIIGNIRFKTFDLGGHETARRLWKDYFTTVDGVVYMVDAGSRRFPRPSALDYLLTCDELAAVPFLVLGNKIDAHSAARSKDTRRNNDDDNKIRPIELFMCSVIRKMGYADGFRWLAQFF
ncbi:hypothetical protein SO694_00017496 [Aureococcus anophagefferens]|uniref:Uncharacterized protein n=1 Tax=Aureococcus anophagefferens TaxID=44056 RepID=A0ABR1G2W9_AURAN